MTVARTAGLGTYNVLVTNADGGVGACAGCFTVGPAPVVSAMSPGTVAQGTTTTVTITGSGFVAGAQVVGPSGVTFDAITVVNATTITAEMTVAAGRAPGSNLVVTVVNPVRPPDGLRISSGGCPRSPPPRRPGRSPRSSRPRRGSSA